MSEEEVDRRGMGERGVDERGVDEGGMGERRVDERGVEERGMDERRVDERETDETGSNWGACTNDCLMGQWSTASQHLRPNDNKFKSDRQTN